MEERMINQPVDSGVRGLLFVGLLSIGLSGCDYWPPALQAQIEQMQVEAQIATAERAKLQSQLTDTMKMKDELQSRVDELSRTNSGFSKRISTLELALLTEREKVDRLTRVLHQPPSSKITKKVAPNLPSKKKPVATKTKPQPKKGV
jgi:hypothetical protein